MIQLLEREAGMAKKKPNGEGGDRKNPADLRREDHSPGDLRRFAKMLETLGADLIGYAKKIEKEIGNQPIEIDGATKIRRGISLLEMYVANVDGAITREKKKRSRFF